MRVIRSFLILLLFSVMTQCRKSDEQVTVVPLLTSTPTPQIGVSLTTRAVPTTAVLQTTPIPLPTATLTPTATPIIYTIVEGDTLLDIAIKKLTTVEEIQALNPEARAELLSIGQQLVLPPPAPALAQGVAATLVPIQVAVSQINSYLTPTGSLWLLGEMSNEGDLPVINAQVTISILDNLEREIGSAVAWAASTIILPGESSPFGVLMNDAPTEFVRPSVSVSGGESITDLGTWYVDIAVGETAVIFDEERIQINGQIQNPGIITAAQMNIIVTFYDDLGNVTGYHLQKLEGELIPMETLPFNIIGSPPGGQTTDVSLTVQASRLEVDD